MKKFLIALFILVLPWLIIEGYFFMNRLPKAICQYDTGANCHFSKNPKFFIIDNRYKIPVKMPTENYRIIAVILSPKNKKACIKWKLLESPSIYTTIINLDNGFYRDYHPRADKWAERIRMFEAYPEARN